MKDSVGRPPMEPLGEFGKMWRRELDEHGWTSRRLATELNINPATFSAWLSGKNGEGKRKGKGRVQILPDTSGWCMIHRALGMTKTAKFLEAAEADIRVGLTGERFPGESRSRGRGGEDDDE